MELQSLLTRANKTNKNKKIIYYAKISKMGDKKWLLFPKYTGTILKI